MNKLLLACAVLMLAACGSSTRHDEAKVDTLANLQPAYLPDKNQSLPSANLDELRDLYLAALNASDDREVKRLVNSRLAGIEMQRSEALLAEGTGEEAQLFAATVSAYEALLADNPQGLNKDKQMYQLARAYEMNGEQEKSLAILASLVGDHDGSDRYIESQFRLAESYFSAGQYREAAKRYKQVIVRGESIYYLNSQYMLAWSQFKSARYDDAISSFIETLDLILLSGQGVVVNDKGDQEIVNDSFKMLSVSFSTLEGVASLNEVLDSKGEKHYAANLYQSLAQYYLALERYRDSADAYQAFIKRYPFSNQSYQYQIATINVYRQGGFTDEVLAAKVQFVADNGHAGQYWQSRKAATKSVIDKSLQAYITELASYFHTLAQQSSDQVNELMAASVPNDKQLKLLEHEAAEHYIAAAHYYGLFVRTFPGHERAADMLFLLAESKYESGSYQSAIDSYERVAYFYTHSEKAVEAGYAAILAYDKLPLPAVDDEAYSLTTKIIAQNKIDSSLRFTSIFPHDSRSPAIQINAAQSQLSLGLYKQATISARALTLGNALYKPSADNKIVISAWLVIAQSAFDTHDYFLAETSYSEVLTLLNKNDKRVAAITDRYAASIYKQGELAAAVQQHQIAAQHFSRVISRAPNSSIRPNAQYDAANSYYAIQDWDNALPLFNDYRLRYPQSNLSVAMGATLALIYQETQQWSLAAKELKAVYQREEDPVQKAQLLFLTAELYEKSGNNDKAIVHYRDYAHTYKEPFDINIEAMNKLNELYLAQGDESKRRFWLKRMISADATAGAQRNDRSQYLAAMSSSVFADDAYQAFKKIKLTLPIKRSLKKKKKSLKLVLDLYQKTAKYGVADFTTLSLHRLAEVYGQLSRDLMTSERPANLDELAMEQYDILLEEQAYPFEEKAISIHEQNIQNSWNGVYDDWVKHSFTALAKLLPGRYQKQEVISELTEEIY